MDSPAILSIAAGLLPLVAVVHTYSVEAREEAAVISVTIPSGTIIGNAGETVETFNGIPYAAEAPIGDLRFRPPVKPSRDLDTFDATGTPRSCPQGPVLTLKGLSNVADALVAGAIVKDTSGESEVPKLGEDCLTINVQRPKGVQAGAGLPVLFWIFGGGFLAGSTAGYNATQLIETGLLHDQPFIFVAVNYRVAAWGFMPGKEILAEGSGNAGLLDQRMGLEWVADNIEAFGGDPGKVTIWGESAGAISLFDQLVLFDGDASYNGNPLFRGAIMNSGSATPPDALDSDKAQAIYDAVAAAANCTGTDSLSCLRNLDNDVLTVAANSVPGIISYSSLALSYLPRPDGRVLTDSPDALQRAGKFHQVPMIIGTQEDEGTLFSLTQRNMSTTEKIVEYLSAYYFHNADTEQVTEFVNTYSSDPRDGSPYRTGYLFEGYPGKKRIAAILGDIVFNLVRRISLQTFASVAPTVPTWSYFSSYKYNPLLGLFGTYHGSDIGVLFKDSNDKYPTISGRTYYINFVHNLDPNNGTDVDVFWPQWKQDKKLLHFKANSNGLLDDTYRNASYTFLIDNIEDLRF
ncbi:dipeptidyl peptidase 5 [Trichoderma parareesei]|uniref:Carboxylic ester hydrolase n=1 Tax=Trichoderma parareesei TaxID=858221 RepID=A0A2H2YYK1_TRIPA|nr:dipeptidyl peptidase 5 [Trichoderma parareesei]